jgi:hypothetical protein
MKSKQIKSLRLTKMSKKQQKVVRGGNMAEQCRCSCYSGLSNDIMNFNATASN